MRTNCHITSPIFKPNVCGVCIRNFERQLNDNSKKIDVHLQSMADVILVCIVLQNLYIITNNKFDAIWIQETNVKLMKLVENDTTKILQISRGQRASIEINFWILKLIGKKLIHNFEIEEVDATKEVFSNKTK